MTEQSKQLESPWCAAIELRDRVTFLRETVGRAADGEQGLSSTATYGLELMLQDVEAQLGRLARALAELEPDVVEALGITPGGPPWMN